MIMDYEERYNAALERASKLRVQNPFDTVGQMIEHIFPDLAESEGESVRNGLIALLKFGLEDGSAIAPGFNVTKEQALAWLEKLGENDNVRLVEEIKRSRELLLNEKKKALSQSEKLSLGARIAILDELLAPEHQDEQGRMLVPDMVIEWLRKNVPMFWEVPCSPNRIIDKFKEDLGL